MGKTEKVIITGLKNNSKFNRKNSSIEELAELVKSVDGTVVGEVTQSLKNPTTHYLGK